MALLLRGPCFRFHVSGSYFCSHLGSFHLEKKCFPYCRFFEEDVKKEIKEALLHSLKSIPQEQKNRAYTHSYSDRAVGDLVSSLPSENTLFVLHGDHSTADLSLWESPSPKKTAGHIPLVFLVPAQNPQKPIRKLISTPISQNDIPFLLINLFGQKFLPKEELLTVTVPTWLNKGSVQGIQRLNQFFEVTPDGVWKDKETVSELLLDEDPKTLSNKAEQKMVEALARYILEKDRKSP